MDDYAGPIFDRECGSCAVGYPDLLGRFSSVLFGIELIWLRECGESIIWSKLNAYWGCHGSLVAVYTMIHNKDFKQDMSPQCDSVRSEKCQ
jgi:hypothetical protein